MRAAMMSPSVLKDGGESLSATGALGDGSQRTALPIHGRHQSREVDPECVREEADVHQAHVAFSPLDAADVRAMQSGALGQRLLAQPLGRSQLANRSTEGHREYWSVGAWHAPTLCSAMTMSLQTMSIITGGGGARGEWRVRLTMGYVDNSLSPGEVVVGRARLHPAIMLPGLVLTVTIIGAIVGIPLLVIEFLNWRTTEMAVTNQRLIVKRGWISRRTIEMQTSKIEHVGIEQGALGRMLGYGTITVRGTGGTPEPVRGIWNPMAFRQAVQGQLGIAAAVRIA